MNLLLDLGNTQLKWVFSDAAGWNGEGVLAWGTELTSVLQVAWAGQSKPQAVFAASVVDRGREAHIATVVQAVFECEVIWLHTPASGCGVRNAYPEPQRLGVDRFLSLVSAYHEGAAPCVLVGVGTALTLDALTDDGQHLGGLIAPGPTLMRQTLIDNTARVRLESPGQLREVANNTADALVSGCTLAAIALTERFAQRMAARLGGLPPLLVHGGDAPLLLPLLQLPARHVASSVLRGLDVWVRQDVLDAAGQ